MFTRALRHAFPSVSKLTFNPLFKTFINPLDAFVSALVPEYKVLPPNHLRVRVGVGNRLVGNGALYLTIGHEFWIRALAEYGMLMSWKVIDIGCGCGRLAHVLRDVGSGKLFTGSYIGVDIDKEAVEWCRSNFDERFLFHLSSDGGSSYPKGRAKDLYSIPERNGSADLVFSTSLFSHLLEDAMGHYIFESARLLKRGGIMHHSFFALDYPPKSLGIRHSFRFPIGRARVESLRQPEAAVAYESSYVIELARRAGMTDIAVTGIEDGGQLTLVARKG